MARRKGQRDDLRRRGDRKFCCGLAPPRIGSDGELLRFAQPEASRIPIVSWLREQADESLLHAQQAGEMITLLGAYPSLAIGPLLDTHQHDLAAVMKESLETEGKALALYNELLTLVAGRSVMLEEYARQMIYAEELHAGEVDKMLRRPGEVAAFAGTGSPRS